MNLMQSIILGIVQGLTEFLPVSSSGHLALVQTMFEDFEQPGLLFDTLLHCGTLLAVFIYFRVRIIRLFLAFFGIFFERYNKYYYEEKKYFWGVVLASIPTAVIGLTLKEVAESMIEQPQVIGYMLIITSLLLFMSDKIKGGSGVTPIKALIIGVSQGIAVLPGLSRSGTTIFTGLGVGLSREEAAEFSFLISMPAIFGATLLQARHISSLSIHDVGIYGVGMFVAFVCGLFAIGVMMAIVKKARMIVFALYCLIVGISAIIWM